MDERFLNFLVLKDGTLFYISETILYVENRLVDNYFTDKFDALERDEKQRLRWVTAAAMMLIFVIYESECRSMIDNPRSFSVGILIHLCIQHLTEKKSATPLHHLFFPSILETVKQYSSYFRKWDISLRIDPKDVIVQKENIVKYLNEITLFWTFLSYMKRND